MAHVRYEVVPEEMRNKGTLDTDNPLVRDLLAGKTLRVSEDDFKALNLYKFVKKLGKSLRSRSDDGSKIIWIEDDPPQTAASSKLQILSTHEPSVDFDLKQLDSEETVDEGNGQQS